MVHNFTSPFDFQYVSENVPFAQYELGYHIDILQEETYDFSAYKVAILGVKESRNGHPSNNFCDTAPEVIRKQLYRLNIFLNFPATIDIGNLIESETPNETYKNMTQVLSYLQDQGLTVIILGGSQDLTLPQMQAFEGQKKITACVVDERIDLYNMGNEVSSLNYLNYMILNKNPSLFQLHIMGYQLYFTNTDILSRLESLYFNTVRLANIRYNIMQYEFMIRDSDMISIDIAAVKQADAPARSMQTPNGLLSDELCMITRLAGMNSKLKSFGLYEINPNFDIRNQTSMLAAQAVWYFLEGFSFRVNLSPELEQNRAVCKEFMVSNQMFDSPLVFWQYPSVNQWWLEIKPKNEKGKSNFFAVNQHQYETCVQDDLNEYVFKLLSKL